MGEGIQLNYENNETLKDTLNQVITELRIVYPDKDIMTDFSLKSEVKADYKRIAQLFSNLLANAITHGREQSPITVTAKAESDIFELSVINEGNVISAETKKHLFKPFSRGKLHHGQEGLGLGLYIANEIASAHTGKIIIESTDAETCFTLQIPN